MGLKRKECDSTSVNLPSGIPLCKPTKHVRWQDMTATTSSTDQFLSALTETFSREDTRPEDPHVITILALLQANVGDNSIHMSSSDYQCVRESILAVCRMHAGRSDLTRADFLRDVGKIFRDINQTAEPEATRRTTTDSEAKLDVKRAFSGTEYKGLATELFVDHLKRCEEEYQHPKVSGGYYGRFIGLVQTTGSGKTRLIDEIGKRGDAIVVYFNLGTSGRGAYPGEDWDMKKVFMPMESLQALPTELRLSLQGTSVGQRSSLIYDAAYAAILAVVDEKLRLLLEKNRGNTSETICKKWYETYGIEKKDNRERLFTMIHEEFVKVLKLSIDEAKKKDTNSDEATDPKTATDISESLSIAGGDISKTLKILGRILIIACDEATELHRTKEHEELLSNAITKQNQPLLSHFVCRVISNLSRSINSPIWTVFLSTVSSLTDFSGPRKIQSSSRIRTGGADLFQPFTLLKAHVMAKDVDDIDPSDAWKVEIAIDFGRPMWRAMHTTTPNQLEGLVSSMVSRHEGEHHAEETWLLSLLDQRLCLDLVFAHPHTIEFRRMCVEKYLTYLVGTSPNREVLYTWYTVEPFLSHFIAEAMWKRTLDALIAMKNKVYIGMVNKGTIGEFVMRLIMTLAKDRCAQDLEPKEDELRYVGSVSIASFLVKMFGSDFFAKESTGKAVDVENLKNLLSKRMINFVQWISREDEIKLTRLAEDDSSSDRQWVKSLLVTGIAIQACHHQKSFDTLVPYYYDNEGRKKEKTFSILLGQAKNTTQLNGPALTTMVGPKGLRDKMLNVYILMDLGVQDKKKHGVSWKYDGRSRALRVHAVGCSDKTFPFLNELDIVRTLNDMLGHSANTNPYIEREERYADMIRLFSSENSKGWEDFSRY